MLTVIRNAQGQIEAACEWVPCDDTGTPSNKGRWIWINQLEVSRDCPWGIAEIILDIAGMVPWAIGAYWYRHKKTGTRIHQFSRQRLVAIAKRHTQEVI